MIPQKLAIAPGTCDQQDHALDAGIIPMLQRHPALECLDIPQPCLRFNGNAPSIRCRDRRIPCPLVTE
jgi:hypothetical protein